MLSGGNHDGAPLGASGVHFELGQYVEVAAKHAEDAACLNIPVIRSWLGHVSLDTTNHYAQANPRDKAQSA